MKNRYSLILAFLICAGLGLFLSCDKSKGTETEKDTFDVSFVLPSSIEVTDGGTVTFTVNESKSPLTSDILMLTTSAGISKACSISESNSTEFTVKFPKGLESGSYQVYIKRGDRKKAVGSTYINVVSSIDFEPAKGTTVYGQVLCDGKGVEGVVVSDGVEVTATDSKGIYELASQKKWGYVFISIPSGYEVASDGVRPLFYNTLRSDAKTVERSDFALTSVGSQNKFKLFILGDMHLANRNNDKEQFTAFTDDWNAYRKEHKSEKMYAIALGDMTWDLYWYSKSYSFPEYLEDMNSRVSGIQIFHTMGNHDNDYKTLNDFDAATQYVANIAPTYYSFNIGKIHFVVLDDIDCSTYDGTTSRNYVKDITSEQLEWLRKDISYISKDTPVVLSTHAQIFYPSGTGFKVSINNDDAKSLLSILNGYTVHIVTGHTHTIFNANPAETAKLGAGNVYEHNSGSICASWWWSGSLTPGVWVSLDGEPAGYGIWDIDGTSIKWKYKATGWDESYQFRSYDLNKYSVSYEDVPKMSAAVKDDFKKYVDAYPGTQDNQVLINIWNWDSTWSLKVTDEKGNELKWTQTTAYDPLHISALTIKRFNDSGLTSEPNFITESNMPHFFKLTAPSADEDLTITVTDGFGNVYTETMQRPKAFNVDDYKK